MLNIIFKISPNRESECGRIYAVSAPEIPTPTAKDASSAGTSEKFAMSSFYTPLLSKIHSP